MAALLILAVTAAFLVLHNPFSTGQLGSQPLQSNPSSGSQTPVSTIGSGANSPTNATSPPSLLSHNPPTNSTGSDDGSIPDN